ncbi:MAG: excinuclease ABC subunit UvrC [Candidatus Adiutrix sp.]|jgi:excinuclease ABC subunit C|nr:excinuclease ABC subunit UvrC [Candidatus Adiutrix sp.]
MNSAEQHNASDDSEVPAEEFRAAAAYAADPSAPRNLNRQAGLEQLRQKALALPDSPGVYLMKDADERIIYVGKAKILPRRVSGYFQKNQPSARIGLMLSKVADFDFMVTATEKESLILENRLIKKHRPQFNVILRDDKTYPSLKLSLSEEYPRLEVVRRPARDGSIIFGPFPSAGAMRDTVRSALRLFPLRQCRRPDVKNVGRPCLNYQMGRCVGPCRPEMGPEEYARLTEQVRLFFQGRGHELLNGLHADMKAAAERYDFEEAARLRDRLNNIRKTLERQVVEQAGGRDLDVFGFHRQDGLLEGSILMVRAGAVSGCLPLESSAGGGEAESPEAALSLLSQYYGADNFVPDEILWPGELADDERETLEDWLGAMKGRSVKIFLPQRGDKVKLLDMARDNARAALEDRLSRIGHNRGVMVELKARLNLEKAPRRLECFDLAHLQGQNATAGLVVMEDCEWKKSDYRRFRIKSARGGDDYGGLREVVARRFSHEDWPRPDLLLLDGGRGQLHAAEAAFEDLGLDPPPLAAIAKIRQEGDIDRIFLPGRKNPADLKAGSAGLLLLARLRDEAHRYVGAYHRRLQSKTFLESPLLAAPGLGPAKRKRLLDHFGSLEKLAGASDQEVLAVIHLQADGLALLRQSLERWRPGGPGPGDEEPAEPDVAASYV